MNGAPYPTFIPYASYDQSAASDQVSLGGQPIGKSCKAFKIRNTSAYFGCAKSAASKLAMSS